MNNVTRQLRLLMFVYLSFFTDIVIYADHQHEKLLMSPEVHTLKSPVISGADIVDVNVGALAYRISGVRMEIERAGDKIVVHNYGHGVAELALSWGSAEQTAEMLKTELQKLKRQRTKNVAVVGNNITALTTAYVLSLRGYYVKLYVSDVSQILPKDFSGGLIDTVVPFKMSDLQTSKELFEKMQKRSYFVFSSLADSRKPIFKGVTKTPCYIFGFGKEELSKGFAGLRNDIKSIRVKCENGIEKEALLYNALTVDPNVYLNDLATKIADMNIIVSQATITSRDGLLSLPEKVIFNCMGLDARTVVNDQDVVSVDAQVIRINQNQPLPFALLDLAKINDTGMFVSYVPLQGTAIIGGVSLFENSKTVPDHHYTEKIIADVQAWFGLPNQNLE